MYPIRFEPIYQPYVWGGKRIVAQFDRRSSLPKIAESWEISDRDDGMSVVMNGPLKGKTLHELVVEMGEDLLGTGRTFHRFPILTKIIDAKENLSVQVHPDETSAVGLKGEAKTEMWLMLDDSSVYAGWKEPTTPKEFEKAIKEKKAEELLAKMELKKGEVAYIPGGRIHAICAGSLIYEVQQNSNTTYRLYDWGRDRELHLKEGLTALRFDDHGSAKAQPRHISSDFHHQFIILLETPYFTVDRLDVFDQHHIGALPNTFQIFYCIEGKATISVDTHSEPFEPGMTYLIPSACKSIDIRGKCQALRVRLNG